MKSNMTRIFILVCLVLFLATNVSAVSRSDKLARIKARKARQLEQLTQSAEQGNAEAQEKLGQRYLAKETYDQAFYWLQKAADQNLASAQFTLSKLYYKGLSVEPNQEKALALITQAATNGYPEAQFVMGNYSARNEDFTTAAAWFQKAAEQNHIEAMLVLSQLFYTGKGVTRDVGKTFDWIKRAAEKGSVDATFKLGACYAKGIGVPQDNQKAGELLKKAALAGHVGALGLLDKQAEQGDTEAQFILARYFDDQGNRQKALEYYLQAARNNNLTAQNRIAELWLSNGLPAKATEEQIEQIVSEIVLREEARANKVATEKQRQDLKEQVTTATRANEIGGDEILPWIEQNATSGDATAQCQMARLYSSVSPQKDISNNPATTVKWLSKGLQDNTDCSRTLANELLDAGEISPQEQALVVEWIKAEAEQNVVVQEQLGMLYLYGSVAVPQNQKEALKLLYRVAGSGDVATQCELGLQYLSGDQLKQNFVAGMAFYYVAASEEVVNNDGGNSFWIRKAKERIAETESEQPEKAAALADARKLARKLIVKFKEQS